MSLLRDWFGPSREEIWRQFAEAVGGKFSAGSFWNGPCKVEAVHGQWRVTLDTYVISTGKSFVSYTRMRAPYVNPDGFRFTVYRRGFFGTLGKLLGMQDVTVGFPQFDDDFIIQGNSEDKLRALFANDRIRHLISLQPDIHFCVKHDKGFWSDRQSPPNVDELYFQARGQIVDIDELKRLFDLFAETLDHLCLVGSAYQPKPVALAA